MNPPPSYSPPPSHQDTPPPYRAAHRFANSTEELAALIEFAQSKKYMNPGKDGSLPDIAAGVRWVAAAQPGDQAKEERRQLRETEKARNSVRTEEKSKQGSVSQRLKRIISGGKEPSVK